MTVILTKARSETIRDKVRWTTSNGLFTALLMLARSRRDRVVEDDRTGRICSTYEAPVLLSKMIAGVPTRECQVSG